MTQLLQTEKSATVADFTLTADIRNPYQNRALTRARSMAPDELHSAGYRHGLENRGMLGSMSVYPDYLLGWAAGYKARYAAQAN